MRLINRSDIPGFTTLATDDFNRADANPIGAPWAAVTSNAAAKILTNRILGVTVNTNCAQRHTEVSPTADQWSQSKLLTVDGGPACRVSDAAYTMYTCWVSGGIYRLVRIVAGSSTVLASYTKPANGTTVRLEVSGVDAAVYLKVFFDGVQQGATVVDTNAARITAAGSLGIYIWSNAIAQDDWAGGNL